jgi:hypothetical protein
MKQSFKGFRRFVSDYGFEGIFSPSNINRSVNCTLLGTSLLATFVTGTVWYGRSGGADLRAATIAPVVDAAPLLDRVILRSSIVKALERHGYSWEDFLEAARHFTSVEWTVLYMADRFLGAKSDMLPRVENGIVARIFATVADSTKDTPPSIEVGLDMLVLHWAKHGLLNPRTFNATGVFGHRQTSEAVGADIGSKVEPILTSTRGNCVDVKSAERAVDLLEERGFVLVRNSLSQVQIDELRKSLALASGPAREIGERIVQLDPNISHSRASPNRLNLLLRGSGLERITQSVHHSASMIVAAALDRSELEPSRLMVSDVRLVVVDEAASECSWTLYNPRGGYSMLIPLDDRDNVSGTYRLIPGSHHITRPSISLSTRLSTLVREFPRFCCTVDVNEFSPEGCWRAGDALIFDNNLLVRGLGNKAFKSGTYLLVKYEKPEHASPEFYLPGKFFFRLARFIELVR